MRSNPSPARREADDSLVRGRLLVVLDVLLSTGSVTLAARHLGLHSSVVSRMLGQLRELLGDPIFMRSGRGLVPTPYAESMRTTVRGLAAGIDELFDRGAVDEGGGGPFDNRWNVPADLEVPPLAFRPAHLLEGQPSPRVIAKRYAALGTIPSPSGRLARIIGIVSAGGTGRGRPLAEDEAGDAMASILAGHADPVQIGAFFSAIQGRGATATELTGFVGVAQAYVADRLSGAAEADLDWPCYISPNYHNPPWFFHAAKLVARAGYRIVLHGASGTGPVAGRHGVVAGALGIPVCLDPGSIGEALDRHKIAYLPLAILAPQIYRLAGLHAVTESRSPVNELVHLLRPVAAKATLLGVAKPSYKEMHRDAARLLGWEELSILGSVRDVAQFTPFRSTTIYRLVGGKPIDLLVPGLPEPRVEARPRGTSLEYWQGVWTGVVKDARAEQIVISTAAAALLTLTAQMQSSFESASATAASLWKNRNSGC